MRQSADWWNDLRAYMTDPVLCVMVLVAAAVSYALTAPMVPAKPPVQAAVSNVQATCRLLHLLNTTRQDRLMAAAACRPGVDPDQWITTWRGTQCGVLLLDQQREFDSTREAR